MKVIDAYPTQPVMQQAMTHRPKCESYLGPYLQEKIARWKADGKRWHKHFPAGYEEDGTCHCKARYQIDGHFYCRKHAALLVLDRVVQIGGKL